MLIVTSKQTHVYRNLALEEWLLDHAERFGPVLFLCVNEPCVVIGKNQNPWCECRLSRMAADGVALARRISGGGAVFHDAGNLNVGVIVPRAQYREDRQYELIFKTLETFGVRGERLGKNSLAVAGKKFSGQAFCFRRQHVLHHGTLLVNADLMCLSRYLGPELDGIDTKAVASVPSEVTNLACVADGLTLDTLSVALTETFIEMYGDGAVAYGTASMVSEEELAPLVGKLSSRDWTLNRMPRFELTLNGQTLQVEKGRITNLDGAPLFSEWMSLHPDHPVTI